MPPRPATSLTLVRAVASLSPLILNASQKKHKEYPEWGSANFYFHIGISVALVLLGGVFAGLTLGLMGLDELHLRVLRTSSDDPKERENAASVLKLLSKGRHWVLVVRRYWLKKLPRTNSRFVTGQVLLLGNVVRMNSQS